MAAVKVITGGLVFFLFKDQNITTCSSCALAFPKYADEQHFLCVFSSAGTGWRISKVSVSLESCYYYFELAGIEKENESHVSRDSTGDFCINTQGNE